MEKSAVEMLREIANIAEKLAKLYEIDKEGRNNG